MNWFRLRPVFAIMGALYLTANTAVVHADETGGCDDVQYRNYQAVLNALEASEGEFDRRLQTTEHVSVLFLTFLPAHDLCDAPEPGVDFSIRFQLHYSVPSASDTADRETVVLLNGVSLENIEFKLNELQNILHAEFVEQRQALVVRTLFQREAPLGSHPGARVVEQNSAGVTASSFGFVSVWAQLATGPSSRSPTTGLERSRWMRTVLEADGAVARRPSDNSALLVTRIASTIWEGQFQVAPVNRAVIFTQVGRLRYAVRSGDTRLAHQLDIDVVTAGAELHLNSLATAALHPLSYASVELGARVLQESLPRLTPYVGMNVGLGLVIGNRLYAGLDLAEHSLNSVTLSLVGTLQVTPGFSIAARTGHRTEILDEASRPRDPMDLRGSGWFIESGLVGRF